MLKKLRVLDLFSGIGGFSLGLEATGGFETAAFCEMNEYADKVLAKHWPHVDSYEDVRDITKERLDEDGIGQIDVICGGFPCQDISIAGKGAGLSGERSGLWFEYLRIIREVGPRWVIIENVTQLRNKGLSTVLQNLSEIGYDAEWHCIPASYVGAPHRRDRIWVVGYPNRTHGERGGVSSRVHPKHPNLNRRSPNGCPPENVADTKRQRQPRSGEPINALNTTAFEDGETTQLINGREQEVWRVEPDVGRVANGVPKRVDRLRCLGNAVVPQIVTLIGNVILEAEHAK